MRLLLLVPIVWALVHRELNATLGLFVVAAASDAADGFLARHFGWRTELGGFLDPLADKLMLASVFIAMSFIGLVPVWLTVAVLARDLIIVLGAIAYRIFIGSVSGNPSTISKLNTLCQMLYVLISITYRQYGVPPAWVLVGSGAAVLVTVVISGIDYVLVYGRRAATAGTASVRARGPRGLERV